MSRQPRPLLNLVQSLRDRGYGASDIARAVHRSPERIRQIMRDLRITKPKIRTDADIPEDLRDDVLAIRNLQKRGHSQA